jgi:hypothetical protein
MDTILGDHQVMASFVDLLLTFRDREEAHQLATFRVEDHLEQAFQRPDLKLHNRSGVRTQHCFNILGIEKDEDGKWQPRQIAAYHSFDVQEARAAWIIMKGDGIIRKRLKKAVENFGPRNLQSSMSSHHSFGQTLRDQLLILRWCTEGWEEYLETMEENRRKTTVMTRSSDIQSLVEDAPKWRERQRVAEVAGQNTSPANPSLARRLTDRLNGLPNPLTARPLRRQDTITIPNKKLTNQDVLEKLRKLRFYSVQMQDMMSRLDQSARVVESIMTRYHNLVRSRKFTQHIKKDQIRGFREHADDFEAQLRIVLGSLESFRARMRSIHDNMAHEGDVVSTRYPQTASFHASSDEN